MRQARKRALSRRKPHQIGFGITLSVFLALCGLMVFERIMLGIVFVSLTHNPAPETILFLYGPDKAFGPFDWIIVGLAGLFLAQSFRAVQAWHRKETSWSGFAFGACNIGMIALLGAILLIYWAFHNPLAPGAHAVNSWARHLGIAKSTHYNFDLSYEPIRHEYSEKLNELTYCHAGVEIIERIEVINPSMSIAEQRANFLARYPEKPEYFSDGSRTATHYYDLEWNLITIDSHDTWPAVAERAEAAGIKLQDGDGELRRRFEAYYQAGEPKPDFSCTDRVPHPFPAPTFPPPHE